MPDTHQPVQVRVGLHTGDAVTGKDGSRVGLGGDVPYVSKRVKMRTSRTNAIRGLGILDLFLGNLDIYI